MLPIPRWNGERRIVVSLRFAASKLSMRSALVPKNFAQTVTHHMCTLIVTGFCMDAAVSHDVTETAEKTIVVSMIRR